MPGGELEPLGRTGPDLPGVCAEMSEIFARAGAPESQSRPLRPPSVSALRPTRSGGRAVTLLAVAAAGLVGLGAGAFVIRMPQPAGPKVAPTPPPSRAPVAAKPALVAEASLPPIVLAPPVADAPVQTRPQPRRKAAAVRRAAAEVKPARLKTAGRREAVAMAQPARCESNPTGPGCREAVIQADRHLRNVYRTAIRRGVPRDVLIDYRDRWADLRERDTDRPARLIQSYGALAYDLGREARDDGEEEVRRRDPSGLQALANALVPWW